jgi:aldose 1-epimerase
MHIEQMVFGTFYNQRVNKYILTNDNGMSVSVLELGGIITHLMVPNNQGEIVDVVLGFNSLKPYVEHDSHYFGAIIGRVANRIEGSKFQVGDEGVYLDGNAYGGKHCVHGGRFGYHRRVWQLVDQVESDNDISITLKLFDGDGEEGFKHNVTVLATYTLSNCNKLGISFSANADGPTPISLTAHSYFNLFGHKQGSINDHKLTVYSNEVLEQKEDRIPSGTIKSVKNSSLCFQTPISVSQKEDINHSYVFDKKVENGNTKKQLIKMATLEADGRKLTLFSNEKTLHFYNGHNLNGMVGKQQAQYARFSGLCLEPKGYVNGVNEPNFPCTIIDKSKRYYHDIIYDFGL